MGSQSNRWGVGTASRRSRTTIAMSVVVIAVFLTACSEQAADSRQADISVSSVGGSREQPAASGDAEADLNNNQSPVDLDKAVASEEPGRTTERQIVYTAEASVEVDNATAAAAALRKQTVAAGGYVLTDVRDEGRSNITLKVPPTAFDATMTGLDKLGKVRHRSVAAADVTAELVDLDARIRSAKLSRDRMEQLMAQAVKVSDVIEIESELQQRDALVEQLTGQATLLKHQVALATVSVQLFERSEAAVDDTNTTPSEGLRAGWVALVNTGQAILVVLATLLPWTPVLLLGAWLARRWWRKTRQRSLRQAEERNSADLTLSDNPS